GPERVPVRLLRRGGLPRDARDGRAVMAGDDDGAGVGQGIPPRHRAAAAVLQPVLARAGHHLGRAVHHRLPDRSGRMTEEVDHIGDTEDTAPGEGSPMEQTRAYLLGIGLAVLLTAASFYVAQTSLIWRPGIPTALIVLAIAQIGIPLVFFLHITTSPDK